MLAKMFALGMLNKPSVMNAAFVFIKQHVVVVKVNAFAKAGLEKHGIKILKEGLARGDFINKNKLINQRYYSIASTATLLLPTVLGLPEEKFHDQFSMPRTMPLPQGSASMLNR